MNMETETKEQKNFVIPRFEDIPVSTKTSIVMTNISFDIHKLFETLRITEYTVIPKKRGRKKKTLSSDPNKDIPDGSIITIELEGNVRGVKLKKKKKSTAKKGEDYFRNSVTIVMVMDNKQINFKISRNGKFQMTGCKNDGHSESCVACVWRYIKDNPEIYKFEGDFSPTSPVIGKKKNKKNTFTALFIPAMRNIDFGLGFQIDREKLDRYFNTKTDYCSLLETSIGYTGVNIKIPFKKPITDLRLRNLVWDKKKDNWCKPEIVTFDYYLDMLKPKEKEKKLKKERYHTFLVFQSGKTIMSSLCEEFARDTYYEFMAKIRDNFKTFQEKLD